MREFCGGRGTEFCLQQLSGGTCGLFIWRLAETNDFVSLWLRRKISEGKESQHLWYAYYMAGSVLNALHMSMDFYLVSILWPSYVICLFVLKSVPWPLLALFFIEGGCILQQCLQDFLENDFWLGLANGNNGGKLEGSRKIFLLPVAFLVSVDAITVLWHHFSLDRIKEGKNKVYVLYLSAFACKSKDLPNSPFLPCYIKHRAVQGCYGSFAVFLGPSHVSFSLVISSSWILQSGSHLGLKWLIKVSHHICVLK